MKELKSYNICFLGRTGNGKSSLINALWNVGFATDSLVSCTKQLMSATIMDDSKPGYESVTVFDTPGIGEFSSDSKYERFYQHAVSVADCVVLVTTFDRTDAPAQRLLMRLKEFLNSQKSVKFIIALNHIDSRVIADNQNNYVSWDEDKNEPTDECLKNVSERVKLLNEKFKDRFLPFEVVPVCAIHNYGIDNLKNKILNL